MIGLAGGKLALLFLLGPCALWVDWPVVSWCPFSMALVVESDWPDTEEPESELFPLPAEWFDWLATGAASTRTPILGS